jgi:hypothetical protein
MVKTFAKVVDILFHGNPALLGTWDILSVLLLFVLTWPMELGNALGGTMWGFIFEFLYVIALTVLTVRIAES